MAKFWRRMLFEDGHDERVVMLPHQEIINGILISPVEIICDKGDIPEGLNTPFIFTADKSRFLVDVYDGEITDEFWLVQIDGLVNVREVYRFLGGRVRIENGKASFECAVSDVKVIGKTTNKTEFFE